MAVSRLAVFTAALSVSAPFAAQAQSHVIERFHRTGRFEADGTGRATIEARVRIHSAAALRWFGQLTFLYSSENQRLDVDQVRVLKATGDTIIAPASAVQDLTPPVAQEAPVYSDLRQKVVTVPGLQPGDTLEYRLTWTTHTPLAAGHFWDSADFIKDAVVLDERLVYDVPRAVTVSVKTEGGAPPRVSETGGRRVYEWRRANPTADTTSWRVPSVTIRQPHDGARLTTFRTWAEVGAWYGGLTREREAVTPEIRQRAGELVRGSATLRDSIAALYDFVSQQFRYVSLSFGIGRYQPHAAAEVLRNAYGDCKDKHVLLAALLRAIGVPSAPVLISSGEPIDPDVPSPAQFDHLITLIAPPGSADTLWVDATPGVAPFGLLLFNLRNKLALVVAEREPARLVRTPVDPPFPTFGSITVSGSLDAPGRLVAQIRYALRGDLEAVYRQVFRHVPEDRWPQLLQELARHEGLSGTVSQVRVSDPGATREPFTFAFQIERDDALAWANRRADLTLPLPPFDLPEVDSTARRDSVPVGIVREHRARLVLTVPAGITTRLPVPVNLSRDFATYQSSYARTGDTIVVERALRFTQRLLSPERARDLRTLARAIDDDQRQRLGLQRTDDAPLAAGPMNTAALHGTGLDAFDRGDFRAAIRTFRQVLEHEPSHEAAWNDLGRAYLQLNRLDSAEAAFRKQIAINPDDAYAHNNLGLALERRGSRDAALAAFRRQIEVNPLDPYAHGNLGRLLLQMRRDSAAVQALERAAAITPDDSAAHLRLGTGYARLGRGSDALAAFERALEIAPSPGTRSRVALELAEARLELERAEAYARQAVESTTAVLRDLKLDSLGWREFQALYGLGAAWDALGWVYFAQGHAAKAEPYARAAWLFTEHGEMGDRLAQVQLRLGRRRDAIRTWALAMNGLAPPDRARRRLEQLVGAAEAERLIAGARADLVSARTVQLTTRLRADVSGRVELLFGSGRRPDDVRFASGPTQLESLRGAIRAASFPVAFPDSGGAKIVRHGAVTCSTPSGACVLVLMPMVGIEVRAVRLPVRY